MTKLTLGLGIPPAYWEGGLCRVKPYEVEGITKLKAHKAIIESRPDFGNALDQDLPEIQWRNGGETGGRMPQLLLDEKYMPYKVTSRYIAKFLAGHYVCSSVITILHPHLHFLC
jgi:hypothetical protein